MKEILFVDGVSEGKNKFLEIVKSNGWWVWNTNHRNRIEITIRELGWNGLRNDQSYEFIDALEVMLNRYLNFESSYLDKMILRLDNSQQETHMLVVHRASRGLRESTCGKLNNAHSIFISEGKMSEPDASYDWCLDSSDVEFESKVKHIVTSLGKEE
jgi:hypothetical protein